MSVQPRQCHTRTMLCHPLDNTPPGKGRQCLVSTGARGPAPDMPDKTRCPTFYTDPSQRSPPRSPLPMFPHPRPLYRRVISCPLFIVVVVVVLRTLLVALLVLSPRDFTAVSATELEQFLAPKLALVGATLIVVSHQLSGLETLKEKYVLTYGPHRPPTTGVGYRQSYVQRELY